MANQSYNIKDVYSVFNKIDRYFYEKDDKSEFIDGSIINYCPYNSSINKRYCLNYFQMTRSGVIHLLENLKKYNLECDKLAEYAILFLSYKLKQHSQDKYKFAKLNDFYTNHIKTNNDYNKKINGDGSPTYKDIIDTKKNLMDINNNEISKFNTLFNILFVLYNGIKNNNVDCTKYPSYPKTFVDQFKELNNDSNINGNNSYSKLLSTLSDDYNNLKNNYGNNNSCNFPPLPKVKTPPNKLIPALSTFSVIPFFLGIAYKYSLFGVDKLFQRQYIRKKLKKVKKKLKLNI
ncbi:CIR protein PIR protein [Plasmodium vinckei brucechwatti]|uniref:CIR protein PIR protein n=1 Tax=Plasmodium vinckei brucechwatti TaxID=119398 RepID=A0A6V7S5I7_PLAVN|nr:CIR protein PIR protein [Plasmodium vinckei brucechwatti]